MSLLVWLPLNGNLNNYGISNITITNSNNTASSAGGKIGNCYTFNGTNQYLTLNNLNIDSLSEFSITCWCCPTTTSLSGFFLVRQDAQHQINLGPSTANAISYRDTANSSSTRTVNYSATIVANEWSHFAFVYKGGSWFIYQNGVLVGSYTGSGNSKLKTGLNEIRIGRVQSTSANLYYSGKLNDFRIYDHALSTLEVKEISQALVLHYKLDGINNSSILPTEYQLLEYIESTGTSYFNTGYKFNPETDSCKVIFKGNDTSNNGMIFASSGTSYFWLYYYGSNGIRIYANNGNGQQGIAGIASDLNQHVAEFKNKTYYIDGINKGSLSNTYSESSSNIWLFTYGNGSYTFKGRIYYVDIKKNGITQKVFIPAKRINDAAIGMYDLIAGTFYTSSNSAFSAGPIIGTQTIQDSSGYGYNGNIIGTLTVSTDTARYKNSCYMSQATTITHNNPIQGDTDQEWTCAMWVKLDTVGVGNIQLNNFNNGNRIVHSANSNALLYLNAGTNDYYNYSNVSVSAGVWTHIAFVFKNSNATKLIYINGENKTNTGGPNKTSTPSGIPDTVIVGTNLAGYISDYRIYATALVDTDIKKLYNTSMSIDDKNRGHAYEIIENYNNLMFKQNSALYIKQFVNGLSRYTQSNCQVTLTDDGMRVYRPANLTTANDGNTMYGGLKICNSSSDTIHVYNEDIDNILGLQKNHTYIWIFHVKGQTANAPGFQVNNNMGWGGGGLVPSPSNVISKGIGSNFDGETDVWYKFTISDEIVKTCTTAYSSFIKDSSYLSYKHFGWNWSYANTGTGTDIYITNIRLYDITTAPKGQITKTGLANFTSLFELNKNLHIIPNEEILLNEFIER